MRSTESIDLYTWRAALLLINLYGKQIAHGRVRLRAAALGEAGATSEAQNWLRIADTIERIDGE